MMQRWISGRGNVPSSVSAGIGGYRGSSKPIANILVDDGRDWFVIIDWASQTSHTPVTDAEAREVSERVVATGGDPTSGRWQATAMMDNEAHQLRHVVANRLAPHRSEA